MSFFDLFKKPVSTGESDQAVTQGEVPLPSDTSRPIKMGLMVLGLGFGGFLLWAGFAPLDEGVPTSGMVSIDTKRKAVQHLSGGLVAEVLVKEGQVVHAGEPLLRIDHAASQANYETVRQHYVTLRAMEGRLLAEQNGQSSIGFHLDLLKAKDDSVVRQAMENQERLFLSRRSALQAELDGIEQSIQGQVAAIQGYEIVLESRKKQQSYLQEQLQGLRELAAEGYAPRSKQLEMERLLADNFGSIAESQSNILRSRSAIAEMKMKSLQRRQEYRKESDSQLADVRREVQADADKMKAANDELVRTTIRSPADGQVVGLVAQTVGGVITAGQKLMDIVPSNEVLLLETRVPPHLIDRVKAGLETDVRFSAFAHSPSLVVEGKVQSVSGDLITEPQNNVSYYLARIAITPEGAKELGNRQLYPGMPAEVVIKTGQRTVLTYLLHPLLKRMAASMKEE